MERPLYHGVLDRKKMAKKERIAYEAFCGLKARSKKAGFPRPEFTAREFMGWWLSGLKSFKGTTPTCGRIDHSRGYSWDNMILQDMAENSREMAIRTGVSRRQRVELGNRVYVYIKGTRKLTGILPSIRTAAQFFGVSQRQIQFLVRGKHKQCRFINFDLRSA